MNDPMPSDFGWKYMVWTAWSGLVYILKWAWANAITILMLVQGVLATLTLDPTLIPHDTFHYILIANAVLCAVLAQIKRPHPSLTKE
jgi:hypothetical protein